MTDTPAPFLRPSEAINLAGQPPAREHVSHTMISTLLACSRKFELDKVKRLSLIARPRYFDMGSAFQKAIELQDVEAGPRMLRGWQPCETCRGRGTLDGQSCPACGGTGGEQGDGPTIHSQDAEDRLQVEEAIVRAAACLYMDRWPADPVERREVEYRVRLRSPWTGRPSHTFDLLGYADGVEDHGAYLGLTENKLVGQITAVGLKRLKLDRQVSLECYGLWRATGKPVREVSYRHTRKPSIKQRQGETVAEFCERLEADYRNPDRRDFYTNEETLFRSEDDLLRVEAELWAWADKLREARRRGFYDRNTSHCTDFGGCQFLPLCAGDPDASSLYQVRPVREPKPLEAAA
jgi:hypothetical protein